MKTTLKSLDDLAIFASKVLAHLKSDSEKATVLALRGNLGSGKTTFAQNIARNLGVSGEITSPTFVIFKKYETQHDDFDYFVHVDAYRLEKKEDLEALHFDEILQSPHTLVLVEWPENISGALPENSHVLEFKFVDDTTREVDHNLNI